MKKSLAILLSLVMCFGLLSGCATDDGADVSDNNNEIEDSNDVETDDNKNDENKEVNPKIKEMEDELMKQLEPLPETNKGEKIGVLIISLTNPFWANMKERYEQAGKELGIEVEVMSAPTEDDALSQLETLDGMVVKDYDSIIFSPIDENNLIPGIVRANQANIPMINLGPGVDVDALKAQGGNLEGRITVDFENQGKIVAEDMLKFMDNKGEVAIIQGLPGAGQSEGRTKGAKQVFEDAKDVEVVSVQPGDWDRNKAYNIATDLIQANPELKGIFACNDVMAIAAAEALEAAGKKEDVVVYGVDFTEEAAEAIKNGKLDGSVGYSSTVYTKAGLLLSLKIAQGQEVTEPVYSPLAVINKENINEFDGWK